MINFNYEIGLEPFEEAIYEDWLLRILQSEGFLLGSLEYIFCGDAYLLKINQDYLNHDTYTDIITFDYTEGRIVGGDVFISVERVKENADQYEVDFINELQRVMAHGLLHLLGYKDKSKVEAALMRAKEEEKIKMFHVEQ
ncbi:rRNA maturation RNase YbeY [uncultured Maribacter sp.]|uniref:rRNA maturation RNase YbeY n=1 Tax=uncultured Maribacter sp. TaxID=431308 RepID=UPI00261304CD|nr:rRNA maturation RNase YbeY [uncultured Maribacter sp.]